jgi:3-hydroxyisobutyrate dehydrogenase-like beta-hydroxyacid dehydrogenase
VQRIGFVGASGLMGHGIAKNLRARGYPLALTVHRNRDRVADLLAAGATEVADAAALAREADIVFICVTGSPQVEAVVSGPNGLLAGARRGLTIIDCSTSEPESTAMLRERCDALGVTFVDAPLARSPEAAELGTLNVMVGASGATYDALLPVLTCFAETVLHAGEPGAGHVLKLLNNFVAQAVCTATAEAFGVGQRAGIDLRQLVALISAGPVNSGVFQAMAKTLDGDLAGLRFGLDNARKDVRYYTHLAESLNMPSVVGEAVHQSLALASALGYGTKFVPSLVEAQEQLGGVKIVPR